MLPVIPQPRPGGLWRLAGAFGARFVRRPRKPAVELTPTVVRSNTYGTVEVPRDDILGGRTANGPHLGLARAAGGHRVTGRGRPEDAEHSLRLYTPAGGPLPLAAWFREHPEARAAVLAPHSDGLAPVEGDPGQ
ncbi:hypothetical protein ACFCV8_32655 [Streptomyces sp. NPDC056347]|uniref:hypothetical protein n=1 Tax=Streptomyces sp. NPDC056347 TaxID=3345790 RepID=UPI0035D95D00